MIKHLFNHFKKTITNQRGSWIVVAVAVVGGAAAGYGAYEAGKRRRKTDLGPLMNKPLPPGSLEQASPGMAPDVNEAIKRAMAGQGYDPEFISRTTSPVIAEREARFQQQELPFIGSELSGRGLGRSTIGVEQTRRAFGQKERDINQVLAEAYRANELEKSRSRQWGTGAGLQYSTYDANLLAQKLQEQYRRAGIHIGMKEAQEAARQANINRAIGTGLSVSGLIGSMGMAGGGGAGGGQQMTGGGSFVNEAGQTVQIPSVPIGQSTGGGFTPTARKYGYGGGRGASGFARGGGGGHKTYGYENVGFNIPQSQQSPLQQAGGGQTYGGYTPATQQQGLNYDMSSQPTTANNADLSSLSQYLKKSQSSPFVTSRRRRNATV